MTSFYDLASVPGYAQLVSCARDALSYAVDPSYASYDNCQSEDGPATYASCLCLTAGVQVTQKMDDWHAYCSAVTVWGVDSVFNNFCSVELQELAPVNLGSTTVPPFRPTTLTSALETTTTTTTMSRWTPSAGSKSTDTLATATTDPNGSSDVSSPSPTSAPNAQSSDKFPVAAIVAIVVVVVLLVVGFVTFCCCWRRIRRHRRERRERDAGRSHVAYNGYSYQPTIGGTHAMSAMSAMSGASTHPLSQMSTHVPSFSGWQNQGSYPPPQMSQASYMVPHSDMTLGPDDSASNIGTRR